MNLSKPFSFSTYAETEAFLIGFVNYERQKWPAYDTTNFDLERFAALLERLGSPHRRPGLIHVAGTKGKGSTCTLLASILSAAGLRTGLYTSPHLTTFLERFRVDGAMISEADFCRLVAQIAGARETDAVRDRDYRTTFEILTAVGFSYFAERACDAAVIETGLGGRLDATNVVAPELTVITALGLDHQHLLGGTRAAIAREKAGIIKPGVPCVLAPQTDESRAEAVPVIVGIARERGAELIRAEEAGTVEVVEMTDAGERVVWTSRRIAGRRLELTLPFLGRAQAGNLNTALAAVEALEARGWTIGGEAIARGVAAARAPARCEIAGRAPLFILDGAHCPMSMGATVDTLTRLWPSRRVVACFSALSDKNTLEMLEALRGLATLERVHVFPAPSPRASVAEVIGELCGKAGLAHAVHSTAREAMVAALGEVRAMPKEQALLLVTGSLYSAEPMRRLYEELAKRSVIL